MGRHANLALALLLAVAGYAGDVQAQEAAHAGHAMGAARAASAVGDRSAARGYYSELLEVAGGGTRKEVAEALRYVQGR